MRSLIFGSLIFLIWGSFARQYYVCEIKGHCESEVVEMVDSDHRDDNLMLKFGEEVILENFEQFEFKQGNHLPTLSKNNFKFLDSLSEILIYLPERSLTITGEYLNDESASDESDENLGIIRANSIKEILLSKGVNEKSIYIDYTVSKSKELNEPISFELFPTAEIEEN